MKIASTLVLAAAAAFLAGAAHADDIQIRYDNPVWNPLGYDNIQFSKNSGTTFSGQVAASRFQATVLAYPATLTSANLIDSGSDFFMYCYDLDEYISNGQAVTYTINFTGATPRTLDYLGAVNYVLNGNSNIWSDPFAWLHPVALVSAGADARQVGAAIQLGIWESLYDTSSTWSLGNGTFQATGPETETAAAFTAFTNALAAADSVHQSATMVLVKDGAQDQITGLARTSRFNVPEPGSLALIGLGLAGLAGLRSRRA